MTDGSLVRRMKGAASLDVATYEEVEHDRAATGQAAVVVALAAVAGAIGAADGGLTAIIGAPISQLVGWVVWAGLTWIIGDKVFGGTADWGELLRTLGFAQTPALLLVLGIIPLLGWLVGLVVWVWVLIAGIIAIRQALDFGTGKAILTAVGGWLVMVVLSGVFAIVF